MENLTIYLSQEAPRREEAPAPVLPAPAETHETDSGLGGEGYRVLLFNDQVHSQDEVAHKIAEALRCPLAVAWDVMMCAHTRGRAVVVITSRDEAERVAGVLREIALHVRVDKVG
jgi:ATP-dependent Clp protease adaptor protein ClpS